MDIRPIYFESNLSVLPEVISAWEIIQQQSPVNLFPWKKTGYPTITEWASLGYQNWEFFRAWRDHFGLSPEYEKVFDPLSYVNRKITPRMFSADDDICEPLPPDFLDICRNAISETGNLSPEVYQLAIVALSENFDLTNPEENASLALKTMIKEAYGMETQLSSQLRTASTEKAIGDYYFQLNNWQKFRIACQLIASPEPEFPELN